MTSRRWIRIILTEFLSGEYGSLYFWQISSGPNIPFSTLIYLNLRPVIGEKYPEINLKIWHFYPS